MKNRLILALLIFSLSLNIVGAAVAVLRYVDRGREVEAAKPWQPPSFFSGDRGRGWRMGKDGKRLPPCLTALGEHFRAERLKLRQEVRAMRKEMFGELGKENPDIEKIESIIDRLADLQSEFQKKAVRKTIETRKTLEPKEKALLDSAVKEAIEREDGKNRRERNIEE